MAKHQSVKNLGLWLTSRLYSMLNLLIKQRQKHSQFNPTHLWIFNQYVFLFCFLYHWNGSALKNRWIEILLECWHAFQQFLYVFPFQEGLDWLGFIYVCCYQCIFVHLYMLSEKRWECFWQLLLFLYFKFIWIKTAYLV